MPRWGRLAWGRCALYAVRGVPLFSGSWIFGFAYPNSHKTADVTDDTGGHAGVGFTTAVELLRNVPLGLEPELADGFALRGVACVMCASVSASGNAPHVCACGNTRLSVVWLTMLSPLQIGQNIPPRIPSRPRKDGEAATHHDIGARPAPDDTMSAGGGRKLPAFPGRPMCGWDGFG